MTQPVGDCRFLATTLTLMIAVAVFSGEVVHATGLTQFELPCGMKVIVKENSKISMAAAQLWVTVGSADERPEERGICHLLELQSVEGDSGLNSKSLETRIRSLGGSWKSYTSWDETVYQITLPVSAISKGLEILLSNVLSNRIDPKALQQAKQSVADGILDAEKSPPKRAWEFLFETAYTESPYRHPIIGYKETIATLTADQLGAFKRRNYAPKNMFLLVVGNVHADEICRQAEQLTAHLRPGDPPKASRPREPSQKEVKTALVAASDVTTCQLYLAFHIPSRKSTEIHGLELAAAVLGTLEDSRLHRCLGKDQKLVHSVTASTLTGRDGGLFIISAQLNARNLEATTSAMMTEVARLANEHPTQEELHLAKTYLRSEHVYARESVEGMARNYGMFQSDAGNADLAETYSSSINMATATQVSRVVKRYLVPPNVTAVALIPEGHAGKTCAEKMTGLISSFEQQIRGAISDQASGPALLRRTLPNGIRVVLMEDDFNPSSAFTIAMLGGNRYEDEWNRGIMNLIARMLRKGSSTFTEDELRSQLQKLGGGLQGFSGYDCFGLTASFLSDNQEQGLEFLADVYRNPSFPQEALEKERESIAKKIQTQHEHPLAYAVDLLASTIFPGHPYGSPKEGNLPAVIGFTSEDVRRTYEQFAIPSNTVISCVGNIDAEKTLKRINELFGSIPASTFPLPPQFSERPLIERGERVVQVPGNRAHFAIGFPGVTFSSQDRYPLDVMTNILSGAKPRLRSNERCQESKTFVLTAFNRPGLDPGIFGLHIACDTTEIDEAAALALQETDRLRQRRISKEELDQAVNATIASHGNALQSYGSRAEYLALNVLYGVGQGQDDDYMSKVREVTVEDVLRVARQYFNPERCSALKLYPSEAKN